MSEAGGDSRVGDIVGGQDSEPSADTSPKIRVLIADDQVLIREAVADILGAQPDISVVGQAVQGAEAVAMARELRPDVVLMDIRMPVYDGIQATSDICKDADLAQTRVLVLTTFEEDDYVVRALRAGASGFIGKGAERAEIVRAVRAIHAGDALLSPTATRAVIARYVRASDGPGGWPGEGLGATMNRSHATRVTDRSSQLQHLTERELEVLGFVARGLSNQEIAEHLVISPHTAKTHVNRIMAKVHVHDRAQLVILAYENRILVPGE